MDYEQKYNEVLARIRPLYEWAKKDDNPIWSTYEYLFPELRESEDERIRAVILKLVLGMRDEIFTTADKLVTKPKVLDWLKKQKGKTPEQRFKEAREKYNVTWKPEEKQREQAFVPKFKVGDIVQHIKHKWEPDSFIVSLCDTGYNTKDGFIGFGIQDEYTLVGRFNPNPEDYGLEKQKPITAEQMYKAADERLFGEQKLTWSEEDKTMLKDIHTHAILAKPLQEEHVNWIDKHCRPQPKQEWSEEDKFILEDAITAVDMHLTDEFKRDCPTLFASFMAAKDWLKSLRPQPHWKPSEEHLSALLAIFNDPNNIGSQTCQLALTDLYEQLKKLT